MSEKVLNIAFILMFKKQIKLLNIIVTYFLQVLWKDSRVTSAPKRQHTRKRNNCTFCAYLCQIRSYEISLAKFLAFYFELKIIKF